MDQTAIPLPMVERIEGLRDGASAIHGADAPWHARVPLGLRNAFDRNPPVSCSSINSFFSGYDVPGRFGWLGHPRRF